MKFFCLLVTMFFFAGLTHGQDSIKPAAHLFDSSVFANDDTLTRSDYLIRFGKVFQTLNKASQVSQSVSTITEINRNLDEDDSALSIIRERLNATDRTLNIRNLQMFYILLGQMSQHTRQYNKALNQYDSILDATKKEIFDLRNDTVIKHVLKDSKLWPTYKAQLAGLSNKWSSADKEIKSTNVLIDHSLARVSGNLLAIDELQRQSDRLLKTTGQRAFSKESRYLWEPRSAKLSSTRILEYKKAIEGEQKITAYYFAHTRSVFYILLITFILFFYWVAYNFKSIKKRGKLIALQQFKFKYVKSLPIFASLMFVLNLAPLFDLDAPAIYIETIVFFLMITLTVHFWKSLPKKFFYRWLLFLVISALLLFVRLLGLPFNIQRWWILTLNGISFCWGIIVLFKYNKLFRQNGLIYSAAGLYVLFHLLAFFCNLFGRVTLTNIFGSTAIFAFVQTISLVIFKRSVIEGFLLQIQGSRIRKEYPEYFEHEEIERGIARMVTIVALFIWLIVFTANLNIYVTLKAMLTEFLTMPRALGNITVSVSGILLFLGIIWVANFLQKYIAYFFGDVGDDASFDNKGQRSRLLITRLILLIAGFLLAVAASGLPLDKITVILGALGIGIGLGLQNIVNNFVSGIILIFDRPIRIGDTVEIGDKKGRVKEITVRTTTLLTAEGAEVIIPNGDILSHNIVNWTLSNTHTKLTVSITTNKLDDSAKIRTGIIEKIYASPYALNKDPDIFINSISSHLTQLKVSFWCKDVTKTDQAKSDIYESIYAFLEEQGVSVL